MTTLFKRIVVCFALALALFLTPAALAAAESAQAATGNAKRTIVAPESTVTVTNGSTNTSFETQPFIFPNDQRRVSRTQPARETTFALPALVPIFLSIIVVCGLFAGALYLAKKYLPGHRQLFSHPAMEVLGRTHLDPRRYVSLVRVGKRILVLGVTQDEINSLSEITDDAEITSILEVARPKTEMGLTLFQRLFQKQVLDNEAAEDSAMAQIEADEIEKQMLSLRERVRAIRENEEPANRVDALG